MHSKNTELQALSLDFASDWAKNLVMGPLFNGAYVMGHKLLMGHKFC
jgi:hypothetical protein